MKIVQNKSVILGVPNDFSLDERIKRNLEDVGFEVFLINHAPINPRIPLKDVIIHNYRKIFKKDRSYKTKIRHVNHGVNELRKHHRMLDAIDSADFSFVIRPDQFNEEILQKITSKSKLSVAYQWDGLERFNLPRQIIKYFDRFFVFDSNDLKEDPNYLPTTNFYFDNFGKETSIKKDVFFIGSYLPHRIDSIKKIADILHNEGLETDINILSFDKEINAKYQSESLNMIKTPFSFEENLKNILSSRIILDFTNAVHHGLSFRTFESIGYRKKLITNNALVKEYDFYNPNNIFVFEDDNFEGLEDFIRKPYEELGAEIYEKYSFSNWIKYLLNIQPHIPLTLH